MHSARVRTDLRVPKPKPAQRSMTCTKETCDTPGRHAVRTTAGLLVGCLSGSGGQRMRTSLARRPPGPGVRTQTVTDALPTSSPATRLEQHLHGRSPPTVDTNRRRPEGPLPGHRPTCSQQQSQAPEDPEPYTSTGSPAPVCVDVAGRPDHSHQHGRRSRSQAVTPPASRVWELVVTGYRRIGSKLRAWEPAAPLSTGHDGGQVSNNAVSATRRPQ